MQLLMGNTSLDNIAKKYWAMPQEDQVNYVMDIVDKLKDVETSAGTDNDILKIDLVTRIMEKILEGPNRVDDFTANDFSNFTWNLLSELAVVAPAIKVVKDTLKMTSISRMSNFTTSYNTVPLLEVKSFKGKSLAVNDPIYPNKSTGTALDIIRTKNPEKLRQITNEKELKDVTDAMGIDPADMPRRLLPRMALLPDELPQPNGVHHTYLSTSLQRKIDNNHLAQQLQKEEVDGLLPDYVAKVARDMGETATPHLDKSHFDINESAAGGSLGTFVVRLGESPDNGFKVAEDARMAAKSLYGENATVVRQTTYGNFSDDLMEGTNAYGNYFIEIRQEQQTTALSGKGTFLGGEGLVTGGQFKPVLNFVFDDDLLFNDKIMRTYSNTRDRANAFGVDLERKAEPFLAISTNKEYLDDFNMLSIKMQDTGVDNIDFVQLTSMLGREPHHKVVSALKSARDINSANWYIKNNAEYSLLSEDRYKTAFISGERYISRPLLNKPNASELKGTRIYDPESKTDLPLTQSVIDGLYEGGGVVATAYKPVKTPTGEFNQIIVRDAAKDIIPLQKDVLPYVKGHFQTSYKDEGFVVVGLVKKKIDGVMRTVPKAMGIGRDRKDASRIASSMSNRGAVLAKEAVVPTREFARRHELKTSGGLALEVSQEKGQRLKGWHGEEFGLAEVVDPYNAYIKALYKTRTKYEQPVQGLQKQRFLDMNKDILAVSKFPLDISRANKSDIFTKDAIINNPKKVQDAISFHRLIRLGEGGDLERASNMINSIIRKTEMMLGADTKTQLGGKINSALAANIKSLDITQAQALASGIANVSYIWGNALFQIMGPVAMSPFLLSQGPIVVAKSMFEMLYEFVPLVLAKDTDNLGTWHKVVASRKGMTVERAEKEITAILDSGIVRTVGKGQDYQTDMSILLQALMESKKTRGATVATMNTLSLPIKLLKGSVLGAMDMFELLTFFVAKNNFVKKNKGVDWTLPQHMKELVYEARGLSLNQNDTARQVYQNADNLLKIPMAMMSYVNRMTTRMYLDTAVGGGFSKLLAPKGSRRQNPWSATAASSLGMVLMGSLLYGESYFDPLDLDFKESQKEYLEGIADGRWEDMLDPPAMKFFQSLGIDKPSSFLAETYYMGMQTSTTNAMFDGDVDWGEMFTPNSYIETMYKKITALRHGGFLDTAFGVHGAAAAGMWNTMKHNIKMFQGMEDLESKDFLFASLEFASQIKLVNEGVAVYYAINLERRVSKSTLSPQEKTTAYEQISKLLGGIPLSEAASRRGFDFANLPRISSDDYQNYMIRKTQMEFYDAYLAKGNDLSESEMTAIARRNLIGMVGGESDLLTEEAIKNFRSKIVEVGKPVEIGGFVVDRAIQEKSVRIFNASLTDMTMQERKEKVLERLGLLKLQIQANPKEAVLVSEKEALEIMLRQFYDKSAEELNDEYLERVIN
ncbi:hypothetical protein N9459_04245 [Flavobacteriaceae bacterium]|nr:hypothetical protein [Flavobacteriaceae bacterium]